MKRLFKFLPFLFIALFIQGCLIGKKKEKSDSCSSKPGYYFSLDCYISNEIKRLYSIKSALEKKISDKNGKKEYQKIGEPKWEQELQIFRETNIDKLAWKNLYKTDTISGLTEREKIVRYTTQDSSLKIKAMYILLKDNRISKIRIIKRIQNPLYTAFGELIYKPSEGYRIKGFQHVKYMDLSEYTIEARFLY